MASKGYKASSQMEENIGSLVTPNYVWVGIYYKCENKER